MKVARNRSCGFTLFEVLAAMLILAITSFIAIPQFLSLNTSVTRMDVRLQVMQDLRRAQAEAITQGCRGIVTIAPDNKSYTFGCDYLSYDTTIPPVADSQSFIRYLPNLFQISADDTIIFNSRGQSVDPFDVLENRTITLSDSSTGTLRSFATGNISGIGMFDYD
jgi:prepilin-type N-terminal cleavage/methylation domain-containing protein